MAGVGDPFLPPLRVYVYEMPKKFTHDLLTLFRNTYRETSNLTSNGSPVHRLIEQGYQFVDLPPKCDRCERTWGDGTWVSNYQSSCPTCAIRYHLLLPTCGRRLECL